MQRVFWASEVKFASPVCVSVLMKMTGVLARESFDEISPTSSVGPAGPDVHGLSHWEVGSTVAGPPRRCSSRAVMSIGVARINVPCQ
jgi:hypothetical protein